MTRDPIAAPIKLAQVKVGYARAEHARAEAAVTNSDRAIAHLQRKIATERHYQETGSVAAMSLADRGMAGLFRALKTAQALKTKLESTAGETRQRLNQTILAEERYSIYQRRLLSERTHVRQRQVTALQDDLHRARLHLQTRRPEVPS